MRFAGTPRDAGGISSMFHNLNRGKRGIAVDMKKPGGKLILHGLVRKVDVYKREYVRSKHLGGGPH